MAASQSAKETDNTITLAEILSDLVSLRVCDPAAALALVSARPNPASNPNQKPGADSSSQNSGANPEHEDDVDLKRAKDLLKYHYEVKEAHRLGKLNRGLEEARRSVERALGG